MSIPPWGIAARPKEGAREDASFHRADESLDHLPTPCIYLPPAAAVSAFSCCRAFSKA